jgi:hypothetical protein
LTAENFLGFSGIIHPTHLTNPIQSSHSYGGNNVRVVVQSM